MRALRSFATPHLVTSGLGALLCLIAGCQIYNPALVGMDAGRDVGPCDPRHAPPRPMMADLPDGPDVAFGMRDSRLDQGSEWANIGLDLDNYCSEVGNLTSECTTRGPENPDGIDGIDNVFGDSLYPLVESAIPGLEAYAQNAQEMGLGQPIIYLRGWNGTPNDPLVDFAIMQAVFTTSAQGPNAMTPPDVVIRSPTDYELPSGDPVPLPTWDGTDWAWVRSDAFVGGDFDEPLIRDDSGYVADGVLVIRLPARIDIVLPTEAAGVLVRLTGATALGVLSEDGMHLEPATVAGRWRVTDLLGTAENVGICNGSGQYTLLAGQLDRIADVRSTIPAMGEPGLTCDAVSMGVTFYGTRLRIAGVTEGVGLGNPCAMGPDGGVADGGDGGAGDGGTTDAGTAAPCVSMGGDAACDDLDPCTADRCDPLTDCVHTARARAIPSRVFQEDFTCVPPGGVARTSGAPPVCDIDSALRIDGALAGLDYSGPAAGETLATPIAGNVSSCIALDFGGAGSFDSLELALARRGAACPGTPACACVAAGVCPDCGVGEGDSLIVFYATDRDAGGCYSGLTEHVIGGLTALTGGAIGNVRGPAGTGRYVIVCRAGWGNTRPDIALDGVEGLCPPP